MAHVFNVKISRKEAKTGTTRIVSGQGLLRPLSVSIPPVSGKTEVLDIGNQEYFQRGNGSFFEPTTIIIKVRSGLWWKILLGFFAFIFLVNLIKEQQENRTKKSTESSTTKAAATSAAADTGRTSAGSGETLSEFERLFPEICELEEKNDYWGALELVEEKCVTDTARNQLCEILALDYYIYVTSGGDNAPDGMRYLYAIRDLTGDTPQIMGIYEDMNAFYETYRESLPEEGTSDGVSGSPVTASPTETAPAVPSETTAPETEAPVSDRTASEVMYTYVHEHGAEFGDLNWAELYVFPVGDYDYEFYVDVVSFVIKGGTCEADTVYYFFTADRNSVTFHNTFGCGHSTLYRELSTGDIYRLHYHMGYGGTYRLYIDYGLKEEVAAAEFETDTPGKFIKDDWEEITGSALINLTD